MVAATKLLKVRLLAGGLGACFFRGLVLFNLSWAAGNKVALLICLGGESEEHSVGGPENLGTPSRFLVSLFATEAGARKCNIAA